MEAITVREFFEKIKIIKESTDPTIFGKVQKSKRGDYISIGSIVMNFGIEDHFYVGIAARAIAEHEARLIMFGSNVADYLYEDDLQLLEEYKSYRLLTNMTAKLLHCGISSKNLVVQNEACCISWFQYVHSNKELVVFCRSTDILTAGKTDLLTIQNVAKSLNFKTGTEIEKISVTLANPHFYTDRTKIARR